MDYTKARLLASRFDETDFPEFYKFSALIVRLSKYILDYSEWNNKIFNEIRLIKRFFLSKNNRLKFEYLINCYYFLHFIFVKKIFNFDNDTIHYNKTI